MQGLCLGLTLRRGRHALRRLSNAGGGTVSDGIMDVEEILKLPSNRALRYVYLRTLPLKQQPEFAERTEETAAEIETQLARLLEENRQVANDPRSAVHLHSACIALSTYRVLNPVLGEQRAKDCVEQAFGAGKMLPPQVITRFAMLFTRDRLNFARNMAQNTVNDFGPGFDAHVADTDDGAVHLRVQKCFYAKFFARYHASQLTKIFCQLDKDLFSPISQRLHGLNFALDSTIADGAQQCKFVFSRFDQSTQSASQ